MVLQVSTVQLVVLVKNSELHPFENRGCLISQNDRGFGHPEFISGSDIQCVGILKQVQDDEINDF
jgi:hypothetical protein